jgi:activator of HSP90 ATPase
MKTIRQTATIRGAMPHGRQRIVQTWRANNWPKGTYSKATFALARAAGGTRVTFTQTGVPDKFYAETSKGWREYWSPLRLAR